MTSPEDSSAEQGTHRPVLLSEILRVVAPSDGDIIVDATFGRGGYARAFLDAADCRVIGLDRDPDAIQAGTSLEARFHGRLTLVHGRFGDMERLVATAHFGLIDAVAFDLGVSSPQLDDARRGFSFRAAGPLDMRMERAGPTAADLVNRLSENELTRILRDYGEERLARRIARAIVQARDEQPIRTTEHLADLVRGIVPAAKDGIDPATRSFQALRLAVNDELGEVERGLQASERLLRPGGRLAAVAFHSLEDRRIKRFLVDRSASAAGVSRHEPLPSRPAPTFRLITRKPIRPTSEETRLNPRSRSARLRGAQRTDAPPWPNREAA